MLSTFDLITFGTLLALFFWKTKKLLQKYNQKYAHYIKEEELSTLLKYAHTIGKHRKELWDFDLVLTIIIWLLSLASFVITDLNKPPKDLTLFAQKFLLFFIIIKGLSFIKQCLVLEQYHEKLRLGIS